MSNRHLARSIVLQTLFEWDFRNYGEGGVTDVISRDCEEFAPGMGDFSFVEKLVKGILAKRSDIDTIIVKAAPDWPLDKISTIDRNILRIGLYELLFSDRGEVPAKVAINEAIELAKTYGGENSGKFVNGVLGSVYKELGEPGKDETSQKRTSREIPTERLGGALVYARDGVETYIALVHDIFGHWTLSKGHLEEKEEDEIGTARVVTEEIGIPVKVLDTIGKNEYVASHPEKGKIRKKVCYYLAEAEYKDLKLAETGGLDDAKWFKLQDILDLNFYNDILPIVTRGVSLLTSTPDKK
jgi:N utilization substance protein B